MSPKDPVVSNFCTQIDILNAVEKADRKIIREKKKKDREVKKSKENNIVEN